MDNVSCSYLTHDGVWRSVDGQEGIACQDAVVCSRGQRYGEPAANIWL